ncbi:hypothetical protein ACH5RR_024652 [Cinchona calisaya]|uniref:F-box domain-containing protein n=1 Tax=Cinchona calisaya TaxID=153742 RepID=A0ABD2Z0Q4_9GENT
MAKQGEENKLMEGRNWTDIPEDLLETILSSLYLKDVQRFHLVCKTWQSVADPKFHHPLRYPVVESQWLVQKIYDEDKCKFFHPLYGDRYCVDIPELRDAYIRYSKDGWLFMSRDDYEIFFYNPFSNAKIELPDLPSRCFFRGVTFTSTPTSYGCMVFGFSASFEDSVTIFTIKCGDEDWIEKEFENNLPIFPSHCNPIFHNEKFYILGKNGNIGVYDPKDEHWTVLDNPEKLNEYIYENYLVDCDGDLMAVFVASTGSQISVYKLDELKMDWEEVNDLGDHMFFLSIRNSFSRKSVIDVMKNKIYFPRFHGKYCVFYSLDTRMYETFGSGFSKDSLFDTAELSHCCWIEPREDDYSEEQLDWFYDSSNASDDIDHSADSSTDDDNSEGES